MKSGKVYLVGAGPGDPGLITVRGRERLGKADVVIYDRLLDDRLLDGARPDAEKIYVGKAFTDHTMPQSEINRLLVRKAREGKNVVRLKGGDPFVLGRGGEEAAALARNHVAFEVVPGVTSAVAVPAYAGIPVTHRKLASSFAVVTGHEDPAKAASSINWDKLATGADTLVFLMGLHNLPEIAARLVEHGRPGDTPVAVIKDGTRTQQRAVVGTLRDIVGRVKKEGLTPPVVIVVGDVVKLSETIRWFDNRPLSGKRILVTRARHQAGALSKMLSERGAQPVELPAIVIRPISNIEEIERDIRDLPRYRWLVFTSVNGVEAFFAVLSSLKLDSRALGGSKIAVIGPATAEALRRQGIVADCQPHTFTSRGLISEFKKQDIAGQWFLLPRADIADEELASGLTRLGAVVREIAVYRTSPDTGAIARAREMLLSNQFDVVTFTSSSTVSSLLTALGNDVTPDGVKIACIGPKTAETAIKAGLRPDVVAKEQTIPGLVDAIEDYYREVA